jgi:putative transposase
MWTLSAPLSEGGFRPERLWRSLKYEEVYLKSYVDGRNAKAGISSWIAFYNLRRPYQQALANWTPMTVWRRVFPRAGLVPDPQGVTCALGDMAVDTTLRLDNAAALSTYPQLRQ